MGEEISLPINDTTRAIGDILKNLKGWDSPLVDERVRAIIATKLQEAQLWSLRLIKAHGERVDEI